MADISVENNDVPVVEKEVEEVAAPKVVEADDEKAVVENGAADESTEASESARENGAEKEDADEKEDDDDDTEEDEVETANGDSTEAPEVLKRKADVTAADAASDDITPEKKQKVVEEANEVDANGADAEVVA